MYLNHDFHKLSKDEYTVKIFQQESNASWVPFKKKSSDLTLDTNKSIKSTLTLKTEGEVRLNFSFDEIRLPIPIVYHIKKNEKELEKFVLKRGEEHNLTLPVVKEDKIEVFVTTHGKKLYWGKLLPTIDTFSLFNVTKLIPSLWLVLFVFLFTRGLSYLFTLTYLIFLTTLYAEYLNFGVIPFKTLYTYTLTLFIVSLVFVGIYQSLERLKHYKLATWLVSLLAFVALSTPLLFILYSLNFNHPLTQEGLNAIFQTNSNESIEYVQKFVSVKYILLMLSLFVVVTILAYRQEKKEISNIETSTLLFMIITFGSMMIEKQTDLRLPNFLGNSLYEYQHELNLFRELQAKRKAGTLVYHAKKQAQGETYIVVIGESLNKTHMGVYGYERQTTPELNAMLKEGLIRYENVYSNHSYTIAVLSFALTQANQYNHIKYYDALSIIEILNKAGFETHWLTNQSIYGGWDNMISVLATEADHLLPLNHTIGKHVSTQHYDEELLPELKKVLAKPSSKNRVIFLHLMGNHTTYSSRYPHKIYTKYTKELNSTVHTNIKDMAELNSYDNSIYYNDHVVSSFLKELQKQAGVTGFIYMSDHADDIDRDLGHNGDKFTYSMTQIPFIGWFSPQYQQRYPEKYATFKAHRNKLFSNDMLYDTLIGLFDIKTDKYDAQYDLSSPQYELKDEDALVRHGKQKYLSPENPFYPVVK